MTTQSTAVEWTATDWTVKGHSVSCTGCAFQSLLENLESDGQSTDICNPNDLAWGLPAGDLLAQWLSDGTTTCICCD